MNPVLLLFALAPFAHVQETPEAHLSRARELEARGELASARASWLSASRLLDPGTARDECVAAERALGMRLALRAEISAARPLDARVFAELGIEQAGEQGLVVRGATVEWKDAPFDLLGRAAAAARASAYARAGLVLERLARGAAREREAALADLGRMVEKKELEVHDASAAVARARGERLPVRGYVFRNGNWVDADVLASAAHVSGLEELALALELAPQAEREAHLAALDALGEEGARRADAALGARWRRTQAELALGTTLEGLRELARLDAELETARRHALELIFDEEKYFYPYDPPACPPEKARLYAGVQQEVDARVAHVREGWRNPRRVRLPERFRGALEELGWSAATHRKRKLEFAWPAELPAWLAWIDRDAEALDVASFASDAAERARLDQDARVAAWNAAAFAVREKDPLAAPNNEERSQLAITNEYRRMLGRPLLAWNRRLQLAAQKHGDYQSTTGEFGHFERDPARRSPVERMRAEGYKGGGGENCHMGDSGPEGAHVGWIHSSGHHRQVLSPRAHELGVAVSGSCWTQNYGDGTEWMDGAAKR